jgi:membrane protein implicated in regulation of membrane protease activity
MNFENIYLGCFTFGFLMSLAAFVAHSAHAHLPGSHGHGPSFKGGSSQGGGAHFPKFNLTTLSAFMTWFGGTGYLLERYSAFGFFIALSIAAASGLASAAVVFWFMTKVLMRNEREMREIDYEMVGVLGRVSCAVLSAKGTGEMIYSRDGARCHIAIRSDESEPIPKDTEVVVTRYEPGVAYVRRWDELSGL